MVTIGVPMIFTIIVSTGVCPVDISLPVPLATILFDPVYVLSGFTLCVRLVLFPSVVVLILPWRPSNYDITGPQGHREGLNALFIETSLFNEIQNEAADLLALLLRLITSATTVTLISVK